MDNSAEMREEVVKELWEYVQAHPLNKGHKKKEKMDSGDREVMEAFADFVIAREQSKQPAASEDEVEELAMQLYLSENISRNCDDWKIQGEDGKYYRMQANRLISMGYRKQSPEGRA